MSRTHQSRLGDLSTYDAFLAVATHRSFRRAAVELDMTPSGISHAIRSLEKRLGVRLFNRTTRSVALSEAGERLAGKLRPALDAVVAALGDIEGSRGAISGTLRLNASEGAIRVCIKPILARFLRTHPAVHLDLVSDGRLGDIVAAGFDAGIRLIEAVPGDMIAVPITGPLRFAVVASPAYLAAHGRPASPRDLADHACIRFRFDSGALYSWELERHGVSERIQGNGRLTLTDQPLMVEAAIDGIGIAFVPEHLAAAAIADGRLESLLVDCCPTFPGLALYYPGHRHVSPALRALVAMLKEEMAGGGAGLGATRPVSDAEPRASR